MESFAYTTNSHNVIINNFLGELEISTKKIIEISENPGDLWWEFRIKKLFIRSWVRVDKVKPEIPREYIVMLFRI